MLFDGSGISRGYSWGKNLIQVSHLKLLLYLLLQLFRRLEFIKENTLSTKKATKKKRSRKKVFSFFLGRFLCRGRVFFLFFLVPFLGRKRVFLFSFINSYLSSNNRRGLDRLSNYPPTPFNPLDPSRKAIA